MLTTALHQGSLRVATASDSEFSTALADSSGFSYLLLPSLTNCRLRLPDTRLETYAPVSLEAHGQAQGTIHDGIVSVSLFAVVPFPVV